MEGDQGFSSFPLGCYRMPDSPMPQLTHPQVDPRKVNTLNLLDMMFLANSREFTNYMSGNPREIQRL